MNVPNKYNNKNTSLKSDFAHAGFNHMYKESMLCSIFVGKNVALWKSTTQSSTYREGTIYFGSDKAVDGSGDGDFNKGQTCTHTAVELSNPRWNVILGDLYYITFIKIKNRNTNREYAIQV